MNIKAFVLIPESKADVDFIASFPHNTEIAVVTDEAFKQLVERSRSANTKDVEMVDDDTKDLGDPGMAGC